MRQIGAEVACAEATSLWRMKIGKKMLVQGMDSSWQRNGCVHCILSGTVLVDLALHLKERENKGI